jgi:hypothetical protein
VNFALTEFYEVPYWVFFEAPHSPSLLPMSAPDADLLPTGIIQTSS